MKKNRVFTATLCTALLFTVLLGNGTAKAAMSPNRLTTSVVDENTFTGTVYCQPSYVQDGKHAVKGYFNWDGYDKSGKRIDGTSKVYTEKGKGPTDTKVYSATKKYKRKSSKVILVLSPCGFDWVPDGSGAWPASNTDDFVTE